MCFSSDPPRDNSAELARQEEAARQRRIAQGVSNIDTAFAGFDQPFYDQYQNDYLNYYNPQLDDQLKDANKKLTLQLAQTGNLTGQVGANQLADLQAYYDQQKQMLATNAANAVKNLRGSVDSRKSALYADNRAAADPGNAASAAASAVTALQPEPPASPLANVFGDFFSNLGNVAAINNIKRYNQGTGVQSYGGGGSSSVRIV